MGMGTHARLTMNTAGKATLSFGMVQLPVKLGKAETDNSVGTKNLCDCGGAIGPMADDDGNKVQCKECSAGYPWYNSAPAKGYEAGDEILELDPDAVDAAREEPPVETGQVEKVSPVKAVLLEYAVTGNYYVVPDDEFGQQYATIERVLDAEDLALLTYLAVGKVRRYAIIAEGGVLLALQLADKRPLDEPVNFEADDAMVEQAATMLDTAHDGDPALDDVEDAGLKDLIRETLAASTPAPDPDPEPEPEPDDGDESADEDVQEEEPAPSTDGGSTGGLARFQ